MKKQTLILLGVFGLLAGLLLNRMVALYEATQGMLVNRLSTTFQELGDSLSAHPFAFSLTPYALLGFLAGFFIVALLFLAMMDNRHYMPGKEYGTARWATLKDLQPFANKSFEKNILLSQEAKMNIETRDIAPRYQRNKNLILIGGSGSGKTRTFTKPNLAQMTGSFVMTDPKGTLVHEMGAMLEAHGYKIKVLDLNTLQNSDKFNPFCYVHDEITLKRIIQVVIDATDDEHARKGEAFWDNSEKLFIGALFSYLYYSYRGDGMHAGNGELPALSDISELVRLSEREKDSEPSLLEIMFDAFEEAFGSTNYAVLQFRSFKNYKGVTRAGVVAVATARFSMFDIPAVRDLIKTDTLEMETWTTEKTAVFITIPDIDKTFNFLAAMVFILAFRTLEYQADNVYHGALPFPVTFFLEEFANLGLIPNIKEALSVFRSRNMFIWIVLQSLNQLKALYKDDWQSFIGNCDTLIYLAGATEPETAKFFSEHAGKATIDVKKTGDTRGAQGSSSRNYDTAGRDLQTMGEVYELDRDKCLVSISSLPMYKGKKYDPTTHPRYKEWSEDPNDGRWYTYRRFKDDFEMAEYLFPKADKQVSWYDWTDADLELEKEIVR